MRHVWNLAQRQAHQAVPEGAWFRPMVAGPGDAHPGAYDVATALLAHAAREASVVSPGSYDAVSAAYVGRSLELGNLLLPDADPRVAGYVGLTRLAVAVSACVVALAWRSEPQMAAVLNSAVEFIARPHEADCGLGRRHALWLCDVLPHRQTSVSERTGLRRVVLLLATDEHRQPVMARRLMLGSLAQTPCPPGCRVHAATLGMALGTSPNGVGPRMTLEHCDVGGLHRQLRRLEREDRKRPRRCGSRSSSRAARHRSRLTQLRQ